jgi:hypothetical protein
MQGDLESHLEEGLKRDSAYFFDIERISTTTSLIVDRAPRAFLESDPAAGAAEFLGEKR